MRLPEVLGDSDDKRAVDILQTYYGIGGRPAGRFTGAWFDTWDSTGTRSQDTNRFTADDLVAVTFLSVDVPSRAAVELLCRDGSAYFSRLLRDLAPDRDLADEIDPLADNWVGWVIWRALRELPGVGPTIASKLLARKRPRLRPIYDSVVERVTGSLQQWEPLRVALRADDLALHRRLIDIRAAAGLEEQAPYVSALRVLDVLTWMQGAHPMPEGA